MLDELAITLHRLRIEHGWCEIRMARLLSVPVEELQSFECGYSDPDLLLLDRYASFLGLSVFELLAATESLARESGVQRRLAMIQLKMRRQLHKLNAQHKTLFAQKLMLLEQAANLNGVDSLARVRAQTVRDEKRRNASEMMFSRNQRMAQILRAQEERSRFLSRRRIALASSLVEKFKVVHAR